MRVNINLYVYLYTIGIFAVFRPRKFKIVSNRAREYFLLLYYDGGILSPPDAFRFQFDYSRGFRTKISCDKTLWPFKTSLPTKRINIIYSEDLFIFWNAYSATKRRRHVSRPI